MSQQLPQREYDRARTDRIITTDMLSRSMSNAKWVRLLNQLSEGLDESVSVSVKLVWDSEPRSMWIRGTQYNIDYYSASMEAMIGGYPRGWYDYKEIEWITFAGNVETLEALKQQIATVGKFDLELLASGLCLYAYRRKTGTTEQPLPPAI